MTNDRLDKIMKQHLERVAAIAAEQINESIRQKCMVCGRGGVNSPMPTVDDLEALCQIRDGFDGLRKDFSPDIAAQFARFDNTISYLHLMIAGSNEM